jgi:two-component system response regulator NreC
MTTTNPEPGKPAAIRLLLVDVHAISRESSRLLLDTIAGLEVIGETGEHREALELTARFRPDVVIVSMRVDGSTGPDTARDILRQHPEIKVVFWTLFDDQEYVRAAFAAGASAYVLKQDPSREIEVAIDRALRGQTYLSTSLQTLTVAARK